MEVIIRIIITIIIIFFLTSFFVFFSQDTDLISPISGITLRYIAQSDDPSVPPTSEV